MDNHSRSLVRAYCSSPTDENAHRVAQDASRNSGAGQVRKVVVAPGHSGGAWSTCADNNPQLAVLLAEDAGLVAAVEALGKWQEWPENGERPTLSYSHPEIVALRASTDALLKRQGKWEEREGHSVRCVVEVYPGDVFPALRVVEVEGPYRVDEYESSESVQVPSDFTWL